MGIPGIVAARYSRRAVLTDYDDACVSNLRYNLRLNAAALDDDHPIAAALKRRVAASASAAVLDWHAVPSPHCPPLPYADPTALGSAPPATHRRL